MTATTLDAKTALVVIDLQKGIAAYPVAHPITEVLSTARLLTTSFRRHGLPVVLVVATGLAPGRTEGPRRDLSGLPEEWFELVPELDAQSGDLRVEKQTWGAFTGTGLEARLKALGVTQVVLAGVSTSAGVESTARQAHELGFNVTLVVDAMTDTSAEAHANSVQRIFPRIGETATARQVVDLLDRR